MKIEDRATEYATGRYPSDQIERTNAADFGFEVGAEWMREEVFIFLAANRKATVKQITEYLKTL